MAALTLDQMEARRYWYEDKCKYVKDRCTARETMMLRFHRVIGTAACSIRIMVAAGLPASAQIKIGAIVRPHCHGGFRRISSLFGALIGAATFSLLEEGLSRLAEYRPDPRAGAVAGRHLFARQHGGAA